MSLVRHFCHGSDALSGPAVRGRANGHLRSVWLFAMAFRSHASSAPHQQKQQGNSHAPSSATTQNHPQLNALAGCEGTQEKA